VRVRPRIIARRYNYSSAAAKGLKALKLDLRPETIAAWKEAAARAGMSQRQAAEQMISAFAREHGVDVPEHPGPKASKPPSPDC
jgi:hypothetical protein